MELIVLDRDGVINRDSPDYVKSPEEWEPIPGSLDAIARLHRGGFRIVVATNQSGIRRELFDVETLNRIHEKMHRQVAEAGGHIEAIVFCPCLPDESCACSKPRPGMLHDIAGRLRLHLEGVPVVGDAERDLVAARAVGARPILVRTGKGERTLAELGSEWSDVEVFEDLAAVATHLLEERQSSMASG